MKEILLIAALMLACATSFGDRILISKGSVTVEFDYNSESYEQILTRQDCEKTAACNPLESGIDVKLITDCALEAAAQTVSDTQFSVIGVSVKKMPKENYWFALVELGETISIPDGEKTLPAFQLASTLDGKCGHIVKVDNK
jgi:hypothetical protein